MTCPWECNCRDQPGRFVHLVPPPWWKRLAFWHPVRYVPERGPR